MSRNSNRIKNKITAIFKRYVKGEASPDQKRFVDRLYQLIGKQKEDADVDFDHLEQEIKNAVDYQISRGSKIRKISNSPFVRVAAVLLLISTAVFIVFRMNQPSISTDNLHVAGDKESPVLSVGDVNLYDLDEKTQDSLSYRIIEDQKVFVLSALTEEIADDAPRKITNPTKKVFTFLLDDGSQVWLNAHSSIAFTPSFGKSERTVQVSGEVSLNVTKKEIDGKPLPFYVKTPLQTVEVLGTQFSVNTQQENEESVVLLEGKIKLEHNVYKTSVVLEPNQKAFLSADNNRIMVASTDEDKKIRAWRKGLFHFEDESLSDVMKELAQWYDKPIHVDEAIREIPITGMISRYEELADVLQIIEMTNNIKLEKRKGAFYVTGHH